MVDESILRLSPMEGLILRRTCMSAAMSESGAGGCVATWRPLHIDLAKSLSTNLMTCVRLAAYVFLKDGVHSSSMVASALSIKLPWLTRSAY